MSNGDWIDRVRSTRPEDYSSGDLGKLRDEARRSPEVRRAIADEIRLDQSLHASLARNPLSTSKIVAAATAAAATAGGGLAATIASWLSVIVLTAAVGVVAVLVLPEPGAGPHQETVSPRPGTLLEPLELIDPIERPRFVDDGSSPSDKLPTIAAEGDHHPLPETAKNPDTAKSIAKASAAEKTPSIDRTPSIKAPAERDEPTGPLRGVTQK
jgi:hypothetical protein